MYQVISSAIVNMPPSKRHLHAAHFGITKWHPIENTEEEIIDFFDRTPENGRRLLFQKLLSNRNWCYFEHQDEQEISYLKVRLWLESFEKQTNGRGFSGYDLFIPNLK